MQPRPLSQREISAAAGLIGRLAAGGQAMPALPFAILESLRDAVPLPVVELCIVDDAAGLLLTRRVDRHWHGWHVPGGFMAPRETVADACDRIARRELGAGFLFEGVIGIESWTDHPYASPVAILCRGSLDRAPVDGRFFAEAPADLLPQQQGYFAYAKTGAIVSADGAGRAAG